MAENPHMLYAVRILSCPCFMVRTCICGHIYDGMHRILLHCFNITHNTYNISQAQSRLKIKTPKSKITLCLAKQSFAYFHMLRTVVVKDWECR
jgi:hypothetical protein